MLLLSYAVNIVAALAIIIVGLIIARMISNAVNCLMISRKLMPLLLIFFLH